MRPTCPLVSLTNTASQTNLFSHAVDAVINVLVGFPIMHHAIECLAELTHLNTSSDVSK